MDVCLQRSTMVYILYGQAQQQVQPLNSSKEEELDWDKIRRERQEWLDELKEARARKHSMSLQEQRQQAVVNF